jgi:hypothetical protein
MPTRTGGGGPPALSLAQINAGVEQDEHRAEPNAQWPLPRNCRYVTMPPKAELRACPHNGWMVDDAPCPELAIG